MIVHFTSGCLTSTVGWSEFVTIYVFLHLCDSSSTHVRNRVDNFAGSNPPGSYLFLKLWNDLQNTLEVRGVEKVLCMSLPQVPEGARLF